MIFNFHLIEHQALQEPCKDTILTWEATLALMARIQEHRLATEALSKFKARDICLETLSNEHPLFLSFTMRYNDIKKYKLVKNTYFC